jgi:hypothetical protein
MTLKKKKHISKILPLMYFSFKDFVFSLDIQALLLLTTFPNSLAERSEQVSFLPVSLAQKKKPLHQHNTPVTNTTLP